MDERQATPSGVAALGTIAHVNLARGFRGGERQTELLVKALSMLGARQALLCRDHSPLLQRLAGTPGLAVATIPERADPRIHGHLAIGAVALVHAHEAHAAHWALAHRLLRGTPYLITRRVDERVRNSAFNRLLYRQAAAVAAVSSPIAVTLQGQFGREVFTVHDAASPGAANPQEAERIRARLGGDPLIVQVGALVDRHKGQSTLIEAVRQLGGRLRVQVALLGSGEDEEELRARARDLPNVSFLGFVPGVADYLAAASALAYPSRHEGLGSTLLEAMAAGCPVVASAVGGIPDLVTDGVSGLLVPPGDPAALAQALQRLLTDPALREQVIRGGQAVAATHRPEDMARAYLSIYQGMPR